MPERKEPEKPLATHGFNPRQLSAVLLLAAAIALLIAVRSCIGI